MEILLKTDSRKVKPGDTFIAITNVVRDGHDYIEQAIANGATKIIAEHGSYSVETVIVKNTREYLNEYLYKNYYPLIKDEPMPVNGRLKVGDKPRFGVELNKEGTNLIEVKKGTRL